MKASDLIRREIAGVFAGTTPEPIEAHARCGPFGLHLSFASRDLARMFLPAYIQRTANSVDLDLRFIAADHHDLSALVPEASEKPRLLIEDGIYSVWQPAIIPVLYAVDLVARRGIAWLPKGEAPPWIRSRPAISLIHAMMHETPWCAVHGAAVGSAAGFTLLAGEGHSGKTTAALACVKAGWRYAGDDFVAVNGATGEIEPLFCSARLRPALVDAFGDLIGETTPMSDFNGELRHELSLAGLGERIGGGRLRALFIPRRRGAASPEFTPAKQSDAFRALLPTTAYELPGWPNEIADKVARISGLAPVFFADTGTTPTEIPAAFVRQLQRL
ncbi:hypothetical protein JJE66_31750 [Bradyrhizobium diazoefficiens]|uniref:hypothetical protein n=1 Tax=Bradyrhizobium diazoefficiens TaxID=1355477 RepID=UPI00190E1E3E|nr:hypothetical protein [Bradyrhizobium diazoefficiens]MBK3665783.1 hypothetical protein [Bradyrhizobium diazoefficiens]